MEFWTYNNNNNNYNNNWRISKNCQDGKSNNKQAVDFQEAFPNFTRLTEEERREFFETLQAAKIKLERSGVNVKPKFGTIHDKAWNYSELLDSRGQKSKTNDVLISSNCETGEPIANDRTDLCILTNELNPKFSGGVEGGKPFENEKTRNDVFSQENAEVALRMNKSFENLNNEKEIEVKAFIEANKVNSKINSRNELNASLSYEILHEYEGAENMSAYQQQKENVVRIKGRNLKVQVTLTSADNERMRKTFFKRTTEVEIDAVVADDVEKSSVKTQNAADFEENLKIHKKESFKERINDPEVEDLLNVEKEDEESLSPNEDEAKDLEKEKGKLGTKLTGKKAFGKKEKKSEKKWSRGKTVELKPPPAKDKKKKTKSKKNPPQDALSVESEWQLENIILEDKEKKFKDHTDSKIIIRKNIKEKNNNKLQTSVSKSSTLKEELSEPDENSGGTQQRILTVTTLKKEAESKASSEEQESDAEDAEVKEKSGKCPRFQKLEKHQRKKKDSFYETLQKKDEIKAQEKENLSDSEAESSDEKEASSEKDPEGISVNSCVADKEDEETPRTAESCPAVEGEEIKMEEKSLEKITNPEPLEIFVAGANETSEEERKQTVEVPEDIRGEVEECAPPFAPGKVVFVDNNVIEKISNVILDLEKKAKTDGVDKENEYLILLMEHVEYLSTIVETMFENQVLHSKILNPCVKFDEENLAEIEECLQISSPTTEDDFDSDEQSENVKKLKRSKRKTSSFGRLLRKCFVCKRKKVRKGGCKR